MQSKLSSLLSDYNNYFTEEADEPITKQPVSKQAQSQSKADPKNQQRVKNVLKIVKTSAQPLNAKKKKIVSTGFIKKTVKPIGRPKALKINNDKEKKTSAAFSIDFSPTRKAHDYQVFEKVLEVGQPQPSSKFLHIFNGE